MGLSATGKMEPEQFKPFELARNLTAEPGQVIALGTFNASDRPASQGAGKDARRRRASTPQVPIRTMPITGRIIDLEGRPVAGVTVQVTQITKPKGDSLDPWIEAVKRGEPPWIAYKHLNYEPPIEPEEKRPKATTDPQGRFRFDGLEAERVVQVAINGPTISYDSIARGHTIN